MEQWKDIPGFEGYYQASSFSRIRSVNRTIDHKENFSSNTYKKTYKGKIKSQFVTGGYYRISLCVNNKERQYTAHRLIALTFIPNTLNKSQVNHKDGNKLNNSIDNLEWCTPSENAKHAVSTGLVKILKGKKSKSYGKTGFLHPCTQKVKDTVTGKMITTRYVAKISGYSFSHMHDVLNGKYKNKTRFIKQ